MPAKVTPGSITQTADAQKDRVNNISNVSSAINRMQKDVDQKISETNKRVERKEDVQQVQSLMNQTLGKLNQTIGALTTGVAKITADTARATASAVGQYGKAISEDISFNKKSVVAMALARTSPIYGYFVAKFMETNVWKQALAKMKTSIMQTMGAILRPFKGGAARGGTVPHAQTGGYIGQGGLAKVHAGETITPSGGGGGMGGADLSKLIEIQQEQLGYMRRTFGFEERYYKTFFERNTAMKLLRSFRRTKGNYTAQLSNSTRPLTNIAHNIATLYTQLMWRVDNQMEIQKANAAANRDLVAHFTGKTYPAIKGIRLKQIVKPLIRKIVSGAMKALPMAAMLGLGGLGAAGASPLLAAGGVAGIGGMMLGKRKLMNREKRLRAEAEAKGEEYKPGVGAALLKRRGVYADYKEPGMIANLKSTFSSYFPSRKMLEKRGMGRGGGLGGTFLRGSEGGGGGGMIGGELDKRRMIKQGKYTALAFSQVLGGRAGIRKPIWIHSPLDKKARKYYLTSTAMEKRQTKALVKIRDSNKGLETIQKKAYKRAGKWRLMGWLTKGLGLVGSLLSTVGGFLAKAVSGLFSSSIFLAAVGTFLSGAIIANFINSIFDKQRDKSRAADKRGADLHEKLKQTALTKSGREGYRASIQSKSMLFSSTDISGDASIGIIKEGQRDYIMSHTERYMNIPADKIQDWRAEWAESMRGRVLLYDDPYEYGQLRETRFLNWVSKNKRSELLSQTQIDKAREKRGKMIAKSRPEAIPEAKAAEEKRQQAIYSTKWSEQTSEQKESKIRDLKQRLQRHLETKYGIKDTARLERLNKLIMQEIPPNLYERPSEFLAFADKIMEEYGKDNDIYKKAKYSKPEAHKFKTIGASLRDSQPSGKVNAQVTGQIDAEAEAKKGELQNKGLRKDVQKLDNTVKETGKETNVNISTGSANISNTVSNSNSESTSVGGGGGGGRSGVSDAWYDRAIMTGGT